jgi:hypothetical protein
MKEEIEDKRYFLEPDDGKITSICVVQHDPSPTDETLSDFTVVIGIIDRADEAAYKAVAIGDMLKPATAFRHGAPLKDGRAVITLSYSCASPFGKDLPVPTLPSPAYVLGVLAASEYLTMADYEKAMMHYLEMEEIPHGLPTGRATLHSAAALH